MASISSIVEEGMSAARGVAGLLIGDRRAPQYFDFGPRGLAGSFIAFFAVMALNSALPKMLGATGATGSIFRSAIMIVVLYVFQVGFSAIVLRQLKRLDGLVPYLVADNWATFFIAIGSSLLAVFGVSGDMALLVVGLVVIVVEINIARLIVTLSPLQIGMFLIAQLVGVSIGLFVVSGLFPLSPAEIEALTAQ
jgi:hypothetical protein